ncbi:MAG: hypothetical protein QOF48_820, partial [Verrucomicrobiota bacterium]
MVLPTKESKRLLAATTLLELEMPLREDKMKMRISPLIVTLVVSLSPAFAADEKAGSEVFPPGLLRFDGASVHPVLQIYKELCGMELVLSSDVNSIGAKITMKSQVPLTRLEAVKLLETTLLDQSGVVLTKLDDRRISVTYNDALPLKLEPGAKPPAIGKSSPVL